MNSENHPAPPQPGQVEQWAIFELMLPGPQVGNPFVDVALSAEFRFGHRVLSPEGFYDGGGVYRIRLMPDSVGRWTYTTKSNVAELDGLRGEFECTSPAAGNHGPVHVHNQMHFAYADGAPYYPFGTTCYAWTHQGDVLEEQTLQTLSSAPFNKMRMCVFPKDYIYNANEPVYYPYQRSDGRQDLTRFDPAFLAALRAARRPTARPGHRGRYHRFSPIRSLGLCAHVGGRRRPLPALSGCAPGRLPQRVVVIGQRV